MGFVPTWLCQVSPPPLLHKTTLTTGCRQHWNSFVCDSEVRATNISVYNVEVLHAIRFLCSGKLVRLITSLKSYRCAYVTWYNLSGSAFVPHLSDSASFHSLVIFFLQCATVSVLPLLVTQGQLPAQPKLFFLKL